MIREDSLTKRYSIKLFANIISGIIGAILIAIVPKALGPIAYGQFIYIQNFFIKIIGFLDMGTSIAFFTKLSANNRRKELISFYFLYSFLILLTIFIFIFFINSLSYNSYLFPNISIQYIYMGLFFAFFTWFTQIFMKISDAYALTVSVELIKIGHRVLTLFLLIYFIYQLNFDLNLYFYFQYISLFLLFFILTILFIRKSIFNNILFRVKNIKIIIKEFIEYCHPLVIYSLISLGVGLFDIWLLQKIAGTIQTGFYGLAYGLATMSFVFTGAMTPIITREFAKSYGKKDIESMRKLFYRYVPMLYALASYFGVFVSIQSENILDIFTDEKFKDAYLVLMVMAIYPIHQTYGQLSGSIFYATGQTKLIRNISLFTQPLGVLVSFLLIYILDLGAIGLAWKMVIVQFIGVIIQLYFNSKFLNLDIKYFLWHQLYTILFFIFFAFISSNLISIESSLIEFLVSGFIYTIFVIIGIYVFPNIVSVERREIGKILLTIRKRVKL